MPSTKVEPVKYGSMEPVDPKMAREKLESASSMHWLHWLIVSLSLLLTFFAWYYSKSELEARIKLQFDREADQVVALIQERMRKYEDALWNGVAIIDASDGEIDFEHWRKYANSIDIEHKYPGINGIGVIHAMPKSEVSAYLDEQRKQRPEFHIHPPHEIDESYPISYIVPVQGNEKAVGLDMAHETNRYTAAKNSRDTGEAQITGPITLVQDSGQTPGFLFYAPFYKGGNQDDTDLRKDKFSGMVYAPFVVKKLMLGVLEKERRHVGIRLSDRDEVLYDEHDSSEADFDPNPMFTRLSDLDLYGRTWSIDIWSAKSFREAATDSQPLTILIGGIFIDLLLILLFVSISRASQNALQYANSMTHQLEASSEELKANQAALAERAGQLERSNSELEQFAYVASHDLQEPLRKVTSFCQMIEEEYSEKLDEDGHMYINYAVDGAQRMKQLVSDLLNYSRVSSQGKELTPIDAAQACSNAIINLELAIEESEAKVIFDALPTVSGDAPQLSRLFQNLIGNAIKYCSPDRKPEIHIGVESTDTEFIFSVADNGIGIEDQYFERIFVIFRRLHAKTEYSGTGIGLAVCKRIVERFGGRIWLESTHGEGSTFFFALPRIPQSNFNGVPSIEDMINHDYAESY